MVAREGSQLLSTRLQLLQTYDILIVNTHRKVCFLVSSECFAGMAVREDSRVFLFLQTYPTLRIICNEEVFGRTEPARAYWMGGGTFLSHPLFLTARHPKTIPS